MMISTRGRYALRVLLDLAYHNGSDGFIPMKAIADRQGISKKYMEQIMPALTKNGLVEGVHGKGGGYRLTKPANDYCVGEILRATEGDLAPVVCVSSKAAADPCERLDCCPTAKMWAEFNRITNEYFDSVRLTDLL